MVQSDDHAALERYCVADGCLCAYTGISPTTFRSGTLVNGRGGIAKLGQLRLRQLLYLCSCTAKRCNPACKAL